MSLRKFPLLPYLLAYLLFSSSLLAHGQQVGNVPFAFKSLSSNPKIIILKNNIKVPTSSGHLQGVQVIEKDGQEKLLLSGSSKNQSYILQADLNSQETEQLISLMDNPFRHAGGIQVSPPYLIVGIEDNIIKTTSKVCIYNYLSPNLNNTIPNLIIERKGEVKRYTSGATGMLPFDDIHMALVANWDSRNWDFYKIDMAAGESTLTKTFDAPDAWSSYQSINLLKDDNAIYAIGTYQIASKGKADLILVSQSEAFEPIMEIVDTKTFNCKNGVDFATAAGIQVDKQGKLHIWATQRDALKQIAVNRYSQK